MEYVQGATKSKATQWIAVWVLVGVNALWGLSFPIMKALNLQMDKWCRSKRSVIGGLGFPIWVGWSPVYTSSEFR